MENKTPFGRRQSDELPATGRFDLRDVFAIVGITAAVLSGFFVYQLNNVKAQSVNESGLTSAATAIADMQSKLATLSSSVSEQGIWIRVLLKDRGYDPQALTVTKGPNITSQ